MVRPLGGYIAVLAALSLVAILLEPVLRPFAAEWLEDWHQRRRERKAAMLSARQIAATSPPLSPSVPSAPSPPDAPVAPVAPLAPVSPQTLRPQRPTGAMLVQEAPLVDASTDSSERILYIDHPAMFKAHPVGFVLLVFLTAIGLICAAGQTNSFSNPSSSPFSFFVLIGPIVLLLWWLNCLGTTLTISDQRTILRSGILSKATTEVWHADIRNVQVKQGILNRVFGIGTLAVSSAGQAGLEIVARGMPYIAKAKTLVDNGRRANLPGRASFRVTPL